ncbi:tPR domain protein [Prevotella sp. CAG:755]|nr:tPR domain protein [Prevotella sp. CAG:755]
MRNKNLYLTLTLASTIALSSCKKLGELTADNFTVVPSPMETVSGTVPVTINGRFPEKYMKKKAVVTVTPVIRYNGGQTVGQSETFQGEKVEGNAQTINYKVGGNYTMKNNFDYVDDMAKSELYLTFEAKVGKRTVTVPDVKIADGVIATSELLGRTLASTGGSIAPDAYQRIIKQQKDAQIKFLIQQANIRNSELKSTSVQDFIQTLRDIKADEKGLALENIEISAYASPDGGVKLNTGLAANREKNTNKYVKDQLAKEDIETNVDSKYTAQDWEGFQELVQASNIQDKDVILRVLSMYKDPEERETQIRNLSAAFSELADEVLPELRRSRLTINYNIVGRSDDEIKAQYKADATKLSVEELLYAASLTDNDAEKADIYKTAARQYPNDYRATNNLAALAFKAGDKAAAQQYLDQVASSNSGEVAVNSALVALANGDAAKAETLLAKGSEADAYNEALGCLYIAKGNYSQAINAFGDAKTNSAALAQILNKDYNAAQSTLAAVAQPDAMTSYLKAIVAARTNQNSTAIANLRDAIDKDSSLRSHVATDLEFRALFEDAAFQSLVK